MLSTNPSYASFAAALSSASNSVGSAGVGITPPKYFFVIATVRLARLPNVFARSVLNSEMTLSYVIEPSVVSGIAEMR